MKLARTRQPCAECSSSVPPLCGHSLRGGCTAASSALSTARRCRSLPARRSSGSASHQIGTLRRGLNRQVDRNVVACGLQATALGPARNRTQ